MTYRSRSSLVIMLLALGVLSFGGCVGLGGCGGSTLLSAGIKIATGQMDTLTAEEILALVDFVQSQGYPVPSLTADQAALIVAFLKANNIKTFEDVNRVIEQAQNDPGSITLPAGFLELFREGQFGNLPSA